MATPSINDLVRYISTKLTGANWNTNFQKVVNWFTDGSTDLNINSVTTTGDVTVGGDVTVTGDVIATSFIGSGAALTGLDTYRKNFIINGTCLVKNNADYTLVKDVYGESVDRFEGMATGTLVTAGTLTQITDQADLRTGFAVEFNQTTITGTGIIYLRHRLYNKDAVNFKDTVGSFSMQVLHDVGSSIPYTIYINKADVLNDFSAVTAISDSGALGVVSGITQQLKYENISMGDCTNGLEILIKVECGAVTLKDFSFGELQLEQSTVVTNYEYKTFEEDVAHDSFIGSTGALSEIVDTSQLVDGAVDANKLGTGASYESAITRYYHVGCSCFTPVSNTTVYENSGEGINTTSLNLELLSAPINLPSGAIITNIKMYYYRAAAAAVISTTLSSYNPATQTRVSIKTLTGTGTAGFSNVSDTLTETIDTSIKVYYVTLALDQDALTSELQFSTYLVTYTIDKPLP